MRRIVLILLVSLSTLAGCKSSLVSAEELAKQKAIYESQTKAILETNGATQPYRFLSSITEADVDAEGYVRMVTWTDRNAAEKYFPAPGSQHTMGTHLTWVTKVSQMKAAAKELHLDKLKGQRLPLRMEQLLGIPPACDTTGTFMEILVRPADLFRPCRDPEINDCECALQFPTGAYSTPNPAYTTMYEGLITSANGYPWTRLGYTWDWQAKSNHFGPSEYIIYPGAVVKIVSKTPAAIWVKNP